MVLAFYSVDFGIGVTFCVLLLVGIALLVFFKSNTVKLRLLEEFKGLYAAERGLWPRIRATWGVFHLTPHASNNRSR